MLTFSVTFSEKTQETKINVLSNISRIFDPLGLLCPVFLQRMWQLRINWDETLLKAEHDAWLSS